MTCESNSGPASERKPGFCLSDVAIAAPVAISGIFLAVKPHRDHSLVAGIFYVAAWEAVIRPAPSCSALSN